MITSYSFGRFTTQRIYSPVNIVIYGVEGSSGPIPPPVVIATNVPGPSDGDSVPNRNNAANYNHLLSLLLLLEP